MPMYLTSANLSGQLQLM